MAQPHGVRRVDRHRDDARGEAAEQQRVTARVGAEGEARLRRAAVGEDEPDAGAQHGAGERHERGPVPRLPEHERGEQDRRPQQVELLLDRERPGVEEVDAVGTQAEVADVAPEIEIGDVELRVDQLSRELQKIRREEPQRADSGGARDAPPEGDARQAHREVEHARCRGARARHAERLAR